VSVARSMRAHRVEVAETVDSLSRSDFASAFAVPRQAADRRSAEQWARDVFERAPAAMRSFVLLGWKYGLGFRLGPPSSPTHVLGWKIASSSPEAISLALQSPLVSAHKLVRVDRTRVVMTTFVRYERAPARMLWMAAVPIHHRTEPYLLGRAATNPSPAEAISGH
jgi:hypothetical protein